MIPSGRVFWMISVLVCLTLLATACGSQPAATEGIPVPADVEPAGPGRPSATPVEAAATPAAMSTGAPGAEPGQPGLLRTPLTSPQPLPTSAGEVPQELLEMILADLAMRLDVKPDEIAVVKVEPVTWSDASLDCPQPGMMYAQVLTPGYRIVLKAGKEVYDYRTAREQYVILCGDDGPTGLPLFPIDPDEIQDGKPWVPVDGEKP